MPVDQYMLSFNFAEIANQVAVVQGSYTDFGRAVKTSTADIITDFETLTDQITAFQNVFTSISSVTDQQYLRFLSSMKQTSKLFEVFAKNSDVVVQNFEKISGFDFKDLGKESPADRISAVIPGGLAGMPGTGAEGAAIAAAKEAQDAADKAVRIAEKARDEVKAIGEEAKEDVKGISAYIQKEMKNARRSMRGIAGTAIPGGIAGGGLIGGLIATMVLGVGEEQRRGKETGELLNVFEAMGNVFSEQGQKMTKWFGGFQQQAQRYWGIAKAQTQAVMKLMVDAGYKSSQIMGDAAEGVYEVQSNVAALSMGLDAYFGLASGASMSSMNELVIEYGDGLKKASNKYTDLMFAAQNSGMGVNKFIDAVKSGSQALTQYGIDVKDVAGALLGVKKHYEDLGMTTQAAGGWAGKGIREVAQGLSAVSSINVEAMRRRHPEMGYIEAKQALQEGWMEKDKSKRYGEQIKSIAEFLEEQAPGDERVQKEILTQVHGWSYLAASTLMTLKDNVDNQGKLVGATKEQMAELDKAFETQGKTLSDLQKTQHDLIDKLYKVGLSMIQVVTGLTATIVTGFATIPMLVKALTLKGPDMMKELGKIADINEKQLSFTLAGFEKLKISGMDLGEFLGKTVADVFPNFDDLKKINERIDKEETPESYTEIAVQALANIMGTSGAQESANWFLEKDRILTELMNQALTGVGLTDFGSKGLYEGFKRMGLIPRTQQDEDDEILRGKPPPASALRARQSLGEGGGSFPQSPLPPPPPPPDPTSSEPIQAPSPEASIWPGPSNVSSPRHSISAATMHNALNQTQSKMPSEIAR